MGTKRRKYSLWVRLLGSGVAAVAIFVIGIGCIFLLAAILDLFGARIRP